MGYRPRITCLLKLMPLHFRFSLVTVLLSSLFISTAAAQAVVPDTEAIHHVGENATVEGMVEKVHALKNGSYFLYFGAQNPEETTFIAWIPEASAKLNDLDVWDLQGRKVKISGKIGQFGEEPYKGKPEIKILSRDQITTD